MLNTNRPLEDDKAIAGGVVIAPLPLGMFPSLNDDPNF
jgi:hypothetical protein